MFASLMSRWLMRVFDRSFRGTIRRRSVRGACGLEVLEPREVLSVSNPALAVPVLSSNPLASAKLYLDFDGNFEANWSGRQNISSPAFSLDADRTTFSDWERQTIREVWATVAEDFASFNVDVTTVEPTDFSNGHAERVVIGGAASDWLGGGEGGVSTNGGFTNSEANVAYVFSEQYTPSRDVGIRIGDAVSHEAGHAFGLTHQSQYDTSGNFVSCYRPRVNGVNPIMGGGDYSRNRVTWANGASTSATMMQDDLSVLARVLGDRTDDFGSTAATLALTNGRGSVTGLIGQTNDADAYRVHSDGGNAVVTVSSDSVSANLVATVEMRSLSGDLLARSSGDESGSASLQVQLPAGDYLIVVASSGEYGAVGQYKVEASVTSASSTLATPTNLLTTSSYGFRHELSWDAADGAAGYRVYRRPPAGRAQDGRVPPPELVATLPAGTTRFTTTVAQWPVTGFEDRWFGEYRVEAFNGSASSTTNWRQVAHQFQRPLNVSNPRVAVVSPTAVDLSWTADPLAKSQSVEIRQYLAESTTTSVSVVTIPAAQTHHSLTGLMPGTRYRFQVQAFNEAGSRNVFYDFTMPSVSAPAAPTVTASLGAGRAVNLTWNTVAGATSYGVSVLDSRGTWRRATLSATTTSYQVAGLSVNTPYRFIVEAVNANGASATLTAPLTIPVAPPAQATGLTTTPVSVSSIAVSWNLIPGADGYKIYLAGSSTILGTLGANQNSFTLTGLNADTNYSICVWAFNSAGSSFSWVWGRTLPNAPTTPTNVTGVAVSATSVRLNWMDSANEANYRIERAVSGATTTSATIASNSTAWTISSLQPDTEYRFRVIATNRAGDAASDWIIIRTSVSPPLATSLTSNSVTQTSTRLVWGDVANETGYRLFQTMAGVQQLIATVPANTTQFTVSGLTRNTSYGFRLVAFNAGGESLPRSITVTTLPDAPMPIRDLTHTVLSSSAIQLNWSVSTGATTCWVYQIDPGTSGSRLVATLSGNATS